MRRRVFKCCIVGGPLLAVWLVAWLALLTQQDLRELPDALVFTPTGGGGIEIAGAADASWRGAQVLDRRGEPLNATFTDSWNLHDATARKAVAPV